MGYALVTPPDEENEPVSLDEAKLHLSEDGSDRDDLIEALITAARQYVERQTGRSLMTTVWRLDLDRFPEAREPIRLAWGPVSAVSAVSYLNASGSAVTLTANTDYLVDRSDDIAKVTAPVGVCWPCADRRSGAVSIQYTAGYGDAPEDVPQLLRQAILLLVGHWYANREAATATPLSTVPMAAESIIDGYRVHLLA